MIFLKRRALMTRASFNYKTVSGIGSITLENCVETRFKRLELLGSSAQGENPSIESPKEIKNSGKYDEVSGKYVIDVGVTGKNLFDINSFPYKQDDETIVINSNESHGGTILVKGDTLRKKQHVISIESFENIGDNTSTVLIETVYKDGVKDERYLTAMPKKEWVLSSTREIDYIWIRNPWKAGSKIKKLQIEEGKEATEYEPYHEPQTVKIQLDEPLRGIGQYKDIVTKDGILRKIKEIVLDENTSFETYWATLNKTFAFISPTIKDATVINFTPNRLLCNYFKALPYSFDRTDEEVCTLFNRRFHMRFLKERNIDTVEKLKEWLRQNPIKVQYVLQEPVLETFENNLGNLYTNDGTTIVSVDSGEAETGIEVEYAIKN